VDDRAIYEHLMPCSPAWTERAACGVRRSKGRVPSRAANREYGHRNNVPSIVAHLSHALFLHKTRVYRKLQPVLRLVGFFFNDAHLRNELLARACAARSPIVRTNGRTGSHQLVSDHPPSAFVGELVNQLNDGQGEGFRQNTQPT
jgi:hypothetical protein